MLGNIFGQWVREEGNLRLEERKTRPVCDCFPSLLATAAVIYSTLLLLYVGVIC